MQQAVRESPLDGMACATRNQANKGLILQETGHALDAAIVAGRNGDDERRMGVRGDDPGPWRGDGPGRLPARRGDRGSGRREGTITLRAGAEVRRAPGGRLAPRA